MTRIFFLGMLLSATLFAACGEEPTLEDEARTTVVAGTKPTLTAAEQAAADKSAQMAAEAEAKLAAARAAEAKAAAEAEAARLAEVEAEEKDYRQTEAYKKASAERRRKRHEKRRLERERREREARDETTAEATAPRPTEYVAPSSTVGQPMMRFAETIHSFDPIEEGEKVTHAFKFTNTGNAPLEITNAEVSCGCTYPSYPFLPIAPGESGQIEVTFNSKGKFGKQKPIVTIYTNTPEKQYKLMLEGEVITEVAKEKAPQEVPKKG